MSCSTARSGTPAPELPRFYGLMQRIASEVPKVPQSELLI
jgi:hypothetical protein